jgi:hypothetical protein
LYEQGIKAGLTIDKIGGMTINELSLFCLGLEEREREEYKRTQFLMWASIQPHSKKRIRPDSLLGIKTFEYKPMSKERYLQMKEKIENTKSFKEWQRHFKKN